MLPGSTDRNRPRSRAARSAMMMPMPQSPLANETVPLVIA
jgi:hypothetical protein